LIGTGSNSPFFKGGKGDLSNQIRSAINLATCNKANTHIIKSSKQQTSRAYFFQKNLNSQMNPSLLFSSERLGFRLWQEKDLPEFSAMNADAETMRYFEKPLSAEESQAMMERMHKNVRR
jgi:hypothetical protein